MKALNFELTNGIFGEYALTNEEMINVRGGEIDIDPQPSPIKPPVVI